MGQLRPTRGRLALFRSGEIGSHVACLQFTVAGSYPWMCEMHGLAMTGTLTVN